MRRLSVVVSSLVAAAALTAAVAAQTADTCTGSFTVGPTTTKLSFVYATVDPLFSEPGKEYLRVVLSNARVPPDAAVDDFALQKLTRDGGLHAVVLVISGDRQIASTQLYDAAFSMDSVSSAGTNNRFEATGIGRGRIAGKAYTKTLATFRDVPYEYSVTFDAAIHRPR